MAEVNVSQEFRTKNIKETTNSFIKEIDQNELMRYKHKKICTTLNHSEYFLIIASAVTECIWISAFCSLVFQVLQ